MGKVMITIEEFEPEEVHLRADFFDNAGASVNSNEDDPIHRMAMLILQWAAKRFQSEEVRTFGDGEWTAYDLKDGEITGLKGPKQ